MQEKNDQDCEAVDALVSQLMKVLCTQNPPFAAVALLGALTIYADSFPELRSTLGRMLLLKGGDLISSTPLYMAHVDGAPPFPTTLQ